MKNTIKILDDFWDIRQVKSSDAHLIVEGTTRIGATWPLQHEIYVLEDLGYSATRNVLRHELCHAYIAATQVDPDYEWNEEAVCEMMAIYGPLIVRTAEEIANYLICTEKSCGHPDPVGPQGEPGIPWQSSESSGCINITVPRTVEG